MKKDDRSVAVEDGTEFTSRTIVGGRPRKGRRQRISIPAGIEKALYKAAIDPVFKKRLFVDRGRTIEDNGIALTPFEAQVLDNVPDERLELMIQQIRPASHGKRKFMKAVASVVVTLATGTAGVACDDDKNPSDAHDDGDMPADVSDVTTEDVPIADPVGILPDVPEDPAPEEEEDVADAEEDVPVDVHFDGSWGIGPDVPPDS